MLRKFFISLTIIAVVLTSACVGEEKLSAEQKNFPAVKAQSLFDDTPAKVEQYLNDGTDYAVYLAYPAKSSETFIYNSKPMRSASMIKVFILATVMEKAKQGEINIDETLTLKGSDKVGGAGILAGYAS
ncbi:MAG: serine hydrolase, partial [Selenomonadaceae bacterium]|nr:serine hydrolase [Selenomonadaceae bacterium]